MKRIIIGVIGLVLLSSCNSRKSKIDPFEPLTSLVDSVSMGHHNNDSLVQEEEEEPLPVKADEIFDDFVYSFAVDDNMQRKRILFPLPFYNMNKPLKVEEKDWRHDSLFVSQAYYTLLFDKEEDMELQQDTSLNSVQFEWINMAKSTIKRYYFERIKGAWILEAIDLHEIEAKENESFIEFFYKFANDSLFQAGRVHTPLTFVTNDPDDDFSILETTIEREQWLAFMSVLPKDGLTNINYGQNNSSKSKTKILNIKGINNGFFNSLYFRRRGDGEWEFYKFEDLSN